MTNDIDKQSFGRAGAEVITDTSAHTGEFCALQILEDAVVSAITAPLLEGDLTAISTLSAGTVIFTPFQSITLTSGSVIAYKSA